MRAKEALERYLQEGGDGPDDAEAWRLLASVCYRQGDLLGEVHAFIERANIETVLFSDISNTANRLNKNLSDSSISIEREVKWKLAERLLAVLDRRHAEADAGDYSRMVWLALNMREEERARSYVAAGLALDPENYYCNGLAVRLGMKSPS